jgi:hypothetical protein
MLLFPGLARVQLRRVTRKLSVELGKLAGRAPKTDAG